jgi:hypothetical protein
MVFSEMDADPIRFPSTLCKTRRGDFFKRFVGSDSVYEFFGWFDYDRLFYGEKNGEKYMTNLKCKDCELSEICDEYNLKGATKEECDKMFRPKKIDKKGKKGV